MTTQQRLQSLVSRMTADDVKNFNDMSRQRSVERWREQLDADYARHFAGMPKPRDVSALIADQQRRQALLNGCTAQMERDGDAIAVLEGERDGLRARVASLEAENNLLRRKLVAWRVCAAIGVVIATWWAWEVAR